MIEGEQFSRKFKGNDDEFQCVIDENGKIMFVTSKYKEITDYEPQEVIGTFFLDRVHISDQANLFNNTLKMISTRKPMIAKYRLRVKNGIYITCQAETIPRFDGEIFIGANSLIKKIEFMTNKIRVVN
jgi:PAS domain S-box-containing protein